MRDPNQQVSNSSQDEQGSSWPARALVLGSLLLVSGILIYRWGASSAKRSEEPHALSGTVLQVQRAGGGNNGLQVCAGGSNDCREAPVQSKIAAASRLKTDDRTRASLDFGERVALRMDRSTEVVAVNSRQARLELVRGSAVLENHGAAESSMQVEVPGGTLDFGAGRVAVTAQSKMAVIDVAHGVLKVVDANRKTTKVYPGQQVRIVDGSLRAPTTNATIAEQLAWTHVRDEDGQALELGRGLGELKAKKPGGSDELKGAVKLKSHRVQVRIVANFVRTQVEEVFFNDTDDVLEGIYRFPLPSDAKIEGLALDVGDKMEQGAFVDRDRAAAIWRGAIVNATPVNQRIVQDDIVWVPGPWRDPALLEWQRGGRFELRVYPIPKHGSRRIMMTYTQVSSPSGEARRYTYPLPYDPSAANRVAEFDVDVQVRGNDAKYGVRPLGYTMRQSSDSGVTRLALTENDFIPHGDITLEYALPDARAELKAWAFTPSVPNAVPSAASSLVETKATDGYAALSLRPSWTAVEPEAARDVVVVVDTSRSMLGENLKRAQRLATRILSELEPSDRGSVLACDSSCEVLPEGLISAGPELPDAVSRFLLAKQAEGASDPTAAVRAALVLGDRGRAGRPLSIVYLGDGTPTVGPIRPGTIEKVIEHDLADSSVNVIAVGVGAESDSDTLNAMARASGGVRVSFLPGKGLDEIAYEVVSAVRSTNLSQISVSLPEGLIDVTPRRPDPLRSGAEMWVMARMQRPTIHGDVVLRGRLGKSAFERRWPIDLVATRNEGNAFVSRMFAAARINDLERMGDAESRREVIDLSQRHHVASRYTSLLVLESEAMFKAFALKKTESKQDWTGDAEDEHQANAELAKAEGADTSATAGGAVAPSYTSASAPRAKRAEASEFAASPAPVPMKAKSAAASPFPPVSLAPHNDQEAVQIARTTKDSGDVFVPERRTPPRRTMIPMRRIWERKGSFSPEHVPQDANLRALTKAEDLLDREPERRGALKSLLALYERRAEFDHADLLIGRWIDKEPLDSDALTARADAAASRGQRGDAIRLLGSVIDARPDDVKAQQRLARLYRWSGELAQSCRYWLALAEFHADKAEWLAQAVRCSRSTDQAWLGEYLLGNATDAVRQQAERLLARTPELADALSGDLRAEAVWSGDADIDIAFITPEGYRVSWLGAPTRQVISARDVTSRRGEGLALRGAPAGSYVIQLVRVAGAGTIEGELSLTVADLKRTVPFTLSGERTIAGIASIKTVAKLVPVWQ